MRETRKKSEVTTYGYLNNISDLQLSKITEYKNKLTENLATQNRAPAYSTKFSLLNRIRCKSVSAI